MLHLKNNLLKVIGYRGEKRDRVVRVVEVRDLQVSPLLFKSVARRALHRSRYLITVHDLNENVFRSYYDAYLNTEPVSGIQRFFWRLAKWFEEN